MNRKEIVNSQDYKATKAALEWWYSLPEEQRKATDIDAEPDIVDAYADGVIYGWNNPQWIPVEDELPEVDQKVWIFTADGKAGIARYDKEGFNVSALLLQVNVTHWMEIQPPRKEDKV